MGVYIQALGSGPRFRRRPPTYADVHCIGYTKAIRIGRWWRVFALRNSSDFRREEGIGADALALADEAQRDGCLRSKATEGTRTGERRAQEDGRIPVARQPGAQHETDRETKDRGWIGPFVGSPLGQRIRFENQGTSVPSARFPKRL
jgi:hypothetical protein